MDIKASIESRLELASSFAIKSNYEDLGVTQYNSTVVNEFAKLNIEKASNKIDRKSLNLFNVCVKSS